ncbi:MAG TPA: glycosyltransferase family A protein [Gemmatimonadales bacterium]|nr:glycosyltransferase family A protein [Gemmatimonadales bacterium]
MSLTPVAPEISVVIPVHNGERYLAESIRSVLDQGHAALELLVIDNGSTDATADVVRTFSSVRYFHLAEKGVSKALNYGLEQCRGAFLAFLDADDVWPPNRLAIQLDAFTRNPTVEMVFGYVEQFISPELEESAKSKLTIRDRLLPGRHRGCMLIRKESFWKVGRFEPSIEYGEFIDWYMRAEEQEIRELMLPNVLTLRRIHGGNLGFTDRNKRVEYARALKRGLDRRRRLSKE